MNLRYFTYYYEQQGNLEKIRQPLAPFLDAYCQFEDSDFKNSFKHNDETVFLLHQQKNHYVFVKTKDTELIKTIDKSNISIDEITKRLAKNESIGFASHIYVEKNFLAFGSTQLAPTVGSFGEFINMLLHRMDCPTHRMVISPLVTQITRAEAQKMVFVGKTTIRVNRSSSIFDQFGEIMGLEPNDVTDLQSFEVILRPLPRRSIKSISNKLTKYPENGIENFQIRARAELHDRMTDFRIESSLVLTDVVRQKENEDIYSAIDRAIIENNSVNKKVAEHDAENNVQTGNISSITKLHSVDNWDNDSPST